MSSPLVQETPTIVASSTVRNEARMDARIAGLTSPMQCGQPRGTRDARLRSVWLASLVPFAPSLLAWPPHVAHQRR